MQRKLPVAEIEGINYYVDAEREELWQQEDPGNRIPFSVFHPRKNGYSFLYNRKSRCLPESKEEMNEHPDDYCWVTLPALMELDPEGVTLRYDIPIEVLCPDTMPRPPVKVVATTTPVTHFK